MKKIILSRGMSAVVDENDFVELNKMKWYVLNSRGKFYAVRTVGKGVMQMHRQILNAPTEKEVDHINGNGLDNRRSNLRLADRFQNNQNSSLRKDNSSGYKGVDFYKKLSKWRSYINCQKTNIHLGYFSTKEEAAFVYDQFAIQLFGDFAKLNILPGGEPV